MPKQTSRKKMLPKIRRRNGRKKYLKIDEKITWFTRGLEVATIVFSLLWTVEASAGPKIENRAVPESRPKLKVLQGLDTNRTSGDVTRTLASASAAKSSDQGMTRTFASRLHSYCFVPESIALGENLSLSFKQSYFYVPVSLTLIRF